MNRGLRLPDEELRSGSRASSGDELGVSHDGRSDGGSSRRGRKDTVGDDAEPPDPDEFDELGSNPSGGNTPRGQMMMTTTTKFDKTMVCMELILAKQEYTNEMGIAGSKLVPQSRVYPKVTRLDLQSTCQTVEKLLLLEAPSMTMSMAKTQEV